MSEWNYIWAAYGLTWLVLGGYAIYLGSKTRSERRRLERVLGTQEVDR